MNILAWALFGLLSGLIANMLDPRPSYGGLVGTLLLGVTGAMLGGFVTSELFGVTVTGFNITSLAIAVAGSIGLLLIGRYIQQKV